MKTRNSQGSFPFHRAGSALLLLVLTLTALLGLATPAAALVAGNAQIVNTATVTWAGAAAPVSASVTVTVNPVAATPVVGTSPTDATVLTDSTYTLENTAVTLTYYVTNKGTGPATLSLTDNDPYSPSGVNGATSVTAVQTSINLGATVTSTASLSGATTLTVPSDGTTDTTVNGITANDYIVIGTVIYQVDSVVDNAASNSATITLKSALTANVGAGVQIGERGSVTVALTTNTLTAPPTEGTYTATVTATSTAGSANATNTVYVQRPNLTISKQVSTDGGTTFGSNTSANPGATLTYRITVTNSGTATAANVVITDPRPAFTSYVTGSAKYRTTTGGDYAGASSLDDDTAGSPDDGYDWGVTTSTTATYAVGNLAASSSQVLYFQVTINN
jgi:uncharacterized repeat protein (TIGR01451 family)